MDNKTETIDRGNIQESLEMKYFQKIQVQKLEISKLKIQIGKLEAEIDHLNYVIQKMEEPPKTNLKKLKRAYNDLMYSYTQLQNSQK